MIKLENVCYQYKNGEEVIKEVNLEISQGEFICLVGKNSSGKSTLSKLIAGLIKPSKGKVWIDELDTNKNKNELEIRKKIAIVFQNPETQLLFSDIQDEIRFPLKNLEKEHIEQRIQDSLKKVGMEEKKNKNIYELSLGQKQRIAIAEALSITPEYLVFDEPTTMLDSKGKLEVYEIVKQLKQEGNTIIYVTNFAEEILLADRILILKEGRVEKQIKKEELIHSLSILKENEVKIPDLLLLATKLQEKGVPIPKEITVSSLVEQITRYLK